MKISAVSFRIFGWLFPIFELLCESDQTMMIDFDKVLYCRFFYVSQSSQKWRKNTFKQFLLYRFAIFQQWNIPMRPWFLRKSGLSYLTRFTSFKSQCLCASFCGFSIQCDHTQKKYDRPKSWHFLKKKYTMWARYLFF